MRRRLANEQDVQDLTQEACLRLLHASRSNRVDNPRAYLYQIANHLLWQHYSGRPTITETSMDIDALPAPQSPLKEAVMAQTRQELVQQAMQALSPKCQTAIVLRWRDGLSVAEIAEHMNLSRAMVKKYRTNALSHFRRRLRRYRQSGDDSYSLLSQTLTTDYAAVLFERPAAKQAPRSDSSMA